MTIWSVGWKQPQLSSDFCPPISEKCWLKPLLLLWGWEHICLGNHKDKERKGGVSVSRSYFPSTNTTPSSGGGCPRRTGETQDSFFALMCFQHINWIWTIVYIAGMPSWNGYNRIISQTLGYCWAGRGKEGLSNKTWTRFLRFCNKLFSYYNIVSFSELP